MERKWTPGPWVVNRERGIRGAGGECVASTYCAGPVDDAHLIAAAPDLYEALEDLAADMIVHMDDLTIAVVHNALAKARGEA